MKKCPEKEILFALLDGELEHEELARVQAHLKSCSRCAEEYKQMACDDKILRQGVEELLARHRVNSKIMAEIKKIPAPQPAASKPADWWQKALIPALALGLLFLAMVFMIPANHRFHGRVDSVSFHALNNESTVDGVTVQPEQKFNLSLCCRQSLQGQFLFSSLTENPAEFVIRGTAMVSFTDQALVVFSDADLEVDLVNGSEVKIVVNDADVSLSAGTVSYRTNPRAIATMSAEIASTTPETPTSPIFEAASKPVVASDSALASATTILQTSATDAEVATDAFNITADAEPDPVIPAEVQTEPASSVEHITNPFVDQPLGQGQ